MPVDKKDYDQFIQGLEIINTIFPEASWKVHQPLSKRIKIQNEIGLEIPSPLISPDRDQVIIPSTLNIRGKSGKKEKLVFEISLTQHFIIQVNPNTLSDEILQAYIQRNALLNIMSVFREKIKEISFQMGLPPLIIPALKIPPNIEKKENEESSKNDKNK